VTGASADVPEILVVCPRNAGRSVAARVLLAHHGAGRVAVRSAGVAPADRLNADVAAVLAERGLDASQELPTPLTDDGLRRADIVITMGCGDSCSLTAGQEHLDWEVADPAGQGIAEVRRIVDDIERRVIDLLAGLDAR
jgi:arsenate reductase